MKVSHQERIDEAFEILNEKAHEDLTVYEAIMAVRLLIEKRIDRAKFNGFRDDIEAFTQADVGLKIVAEQLRNYFEGEEDNED